MNSIRIVLVACAFLSALVGPLWLTFVFALAVSLRYRAWEIVPIGMFMDLLWMPHSVSFHAMPIATLAALTLILVLEPLRRELMIRTSVL